MKHESAQAVEAPFPSIPEGIWLVKTRSGVLTLTLDQLDHAFQRGNIDASTPVLTAGMTEWQTLGVVADLDAPVANDTAVDPTAVDPTAVDPPAVDPARAATSEPSGARSVAPPPRRLTPPPLADGRSFPPTTTAVFGNGASVWTSIATPEPELETGVRRNAAVVPFAVRRGFGGMLDFGSNLMAHLRATHPRWAAVGPWLFGAALSGIFVFALYRLANAPPGPGAHTRSGPAVSYAAASTAVASAAPSAREPAAASAAAPRAPSAIPADVEAVATTRAASMPNDDDAIGRAEGDVLRTRDLKFASTRSERQATSGRAKVKAKAWSKRSKARAARKGRRGQRSENAGLLP